MYGIFNEYGSNGSMKSKKENPSYSLDDQLNNWKLKLEKWIMYRMNIG